MKIHTVLLLSLILLSVLFRQASAAETHRLQTIGEIKARALEGVAFLTNEQLLERASQNSKLVLLDVRTQREFQAGHLPGASWVERGIAEFVLARTLVDQTSEIIVYCKKGFRAALVVKSLRDAGYSNVSAHAGFDAWSSAGHRYANYLGESVLVEPSTINAASFKPDYYQPKLK